MTSVIQRIRRHIRAFLGGEKGIPSHTEKTPPPEQLPRDQQEKGERDILSQIPRQLRVPKRRSFGKDPRTDNPILQPREWRRHTIVLGKPGLGKTTFLLSQMLQDAREGEGVLLIDPHGGIGGLSWKLLSWLPEERWDDVVYINPATMMDEEFDNKAVALNWLERMPGISDDVIMSLFMEALKKNYERFWGPLLDSVLSHGLKLVFNTTPSPKNPTIRLLGDVIPNRNGIRSELIQECDDEEVEKFWTRDFHDYDRGDYRSSMNKIYKILGSEIMSFFADAEKSTVDLPDALERGKIVIVELPVGRLVGENVRFIGSMLLAKIYQIGVMREGIPEKERTPINVYIDEAHKFVTQTIQSNMEELRKFGVFLTIASQNLREYDESYRSELPELTDNVVAFRCGEDTSRQIAGEFDIRLGGGDTETHKHIMQLNTFMFYISTIEGGVPEVYLGKTVDPGEGPIDPTEVMRHSLKLYGKRIRREEEKEVRTPYPEPVKPIEHAVLDFLDEEDEIRYNKAYKNIAGGWEFKRGWVMDAFSKLLARGLIEKDTKSVRENKRDAQSSNPYYRLTEEGDEILYPPVRGENKEHVETLCKAIFKVRDGERRFVVPTSLAREKKPGLARDSDIVWFKGGDHEWDRYPDAWVFPMKQATTGGRWANKRPLELWDNPRGIALEAITTENPDTITKKFENACDVLHVPLILAVNDNVDRKQVEETLGRAGADIVHDIGEKPHPSKVQIVKVDESIEDEMNGWQRDRLRNQIAESLEITEWKPLPGGDEENPSENEVEDATARETGIEWEPIENMERLTTSEERKLSFEDQLQRALTRAIKGSDVPLIGRDPKRPGEDVDEYANGYETPVFKGFKGKIEDWKLTPEQHFTLTLMEERYTPEMWTRKLDRGDGLSMNELREEWRKHPILEDTPRNPQRIIDEILKPLQRLKLAAFKKRGDHKFNALTDRGHDFLYLPYPEFERSKVIHQLKVRAAQHACRTMLCLTDPTWHGAKQVEHEGAPKEPEPDLFVIPPSARMKKWRWGKALHGEVISREEQVESALRKNLGYELVEGEMRRVKRPRRTIFFPTSVEEAQTIKEESGEFLKKRDIPGKVTVGLRQVDHDTLVVLQPIENPLMSEEEIEEGKRRETLKKIARAKLKGGRVYFHIVKGRGYAQVKLPSDDHPHGAGRASERVIRTVEKWNDDKDKIRKWLEDAEWPWKKDVENAILHEAEKPHKDDRMLEITDDKIVIGKHEWRRTPERVEFVKEQIKRQR